MSANRTAPARVTEPVRSSEPRTVVHPMTKRIWVTWEKQRRNATISAALGCRLYEFNLRYSRFVRYPIALYLTLRAFLKERPALIFVQNPSIVLSAFGVAYGWLLRIPVVVDTHNAGVDPFDGKSAWANTLTRFIRRRASLTILSNRALADTLRAERRIAPIAILPDPIPDFQPPRVTPLLRGKNNVLFICSWADDEPFIEVIRAARHLPEDTYIYITGRSKGQEAAYGAPLPPNVVLTGYLSEDDFVGLLHACDLVVDLTTREHCLVCGAYEAVSAERPMVLSGTDALRAYFDRGVLYTDNTCTDLVAKICEAIAVKDSLVRDIRSLKADLIRGWQEDRKALDASLDALERRRRSKRSLGHGADAPGSTTGR